MDTRTAYAYLLSVASLLTMLFDSSIALMDSDSDGGPPSAEARLINSLLDRYQSYGNINRPVTNSSEAVSVWFGLRLVNLEVDEKHQVIKTSGWVRVVVSLQRWFDEHLKWNVTEHEDIKMITLPVDSVWMPDISLVNRGEPEMSEMTADLQVKHTGRVFWAPYRRYTSACLIDVSNYPYDKHTCSLWFQSLSKYSSHLDLLEYYSSPFDMETYLQSYKESQEWEISNNTTERFEKSRSEGVILMYSRRVALKFSITLSRRPGFKGMLLVIPCLLLSLLIPLIFCLPMERPDRHTLATSLFASFTILLLLVTDTAPPSAASIPKIGIYYCYNMSTLILAFFTSATVISISKMAEKRKEMPSSVKKVFLGVLGPCVGIANTSHRGEPTRDTAVTDHVVATGPNDAQQLWALLDTRLDRIESMLQSPARPAKAGCHGVSDDWKTLAMILDRVFFVLFGIINIIAIVLFFPRPDQ